MNKLPRPIHYAFLAFGSFSMALLSFAGVMFHAGPAGKILTGSIWSIACIGWTILLAGSVRNKDVEGEIHSI